MAEKEVRVSPIFLNSFLAAAQVEQRDKSAKAIFGETILKPKWKLRLMRLTTAPAALYNWRMKNCVLAQNRALTMANCFVLKEKEGKVAALSTMGTYLYA